MAQYWTEEATSTTVTWEPANQGPHIDTLITPSGTGGFALAPASFQRGDYSVDLQRVTRENRGARGEFSLVAGEANDVAGYGMAFGRSRTNGEINSDRGGLAYGQAMNGRIVSTEDGALAAGSVGNALAPNLPVLKGNIEATYYGAQAHGRAFNGATIRASGAGSSAQGLAVTGIIQNAAAGAVAAGYVVGQNTEITIETECSGSYIFGLSGSSRVVDPNSFGRMIVEQGAHGTYGAGIRGYSHGLIRVGGGNNAGDICAVVEDRASATSAGNYDEEPNNTKQHILGKIHGYADGYNTNPDLREKLEVSGVAPVVSGRNLRVYDDYAHAVGRHGTVSSTTGNENALIQSRASFSVMGGAEDVDAVRGASVVIGSELFGATPVGVVATSNFLAHGSGYAEYFEWATDSIPVNNNENENIGRFVMMHTKKSNDSDSDESSDENFTENDRITIATHTNDVIGVVVPKRGTVGFVANTAELHWSDANQTNFTGNYITVPSIKQDALFIVRSYRVVVDDTIRNLFVTKDNQALIDELSNMQINISVHNEETHQTAIVPMPQENREAMFNQLRAINPEYRTLPNPDYNINTQYVPRSQRVQWASVALMGQIRVRHDGSLTPGKKCACNKHGFATKGNRWRVLKVHDKQWATILLTPQ